jgi:SAM-dependent methyltransferase
MAAPDQQTPDNSGFDAQVAYSARVNNFWQGGKDNFAADRAAGIEALEAFPQLPAALRAGVAFRERAVRFLVDEGIRQFLDLGCGLPAGDPVHELAQAVAPDSRVVYVDNDPMVIRHAQALYESSPKGACGFVLADVLDSGSVFAEAARTLDFGEPVAVLMASLLHLIPADEDAYGLVSAVRSLMAPGSFLLIVHPSSDIRPQSSRRMEARLNDLVAQKRSYRDRAQVSEFFASLDLAPPGVVGVPAWRPDSEYAAAAPTMAWCGVGRKPLP